MLTVLHLKLAAKTGLLGVSLATAVAHTVPNRDPGPEIPQTLAVISAPFEYRLAGDFQEEGRPVDGPRTLRRLPGFRIMKFQVTTTQYDACVKAAACRARPRMQKADPTAPAVYLSYEDASAYAAWLTERTGDYWRLPTDTEWIAAAGSRAHDDGLKLPRDADISDRWLAKYDSESRDGREERPKPIGSFGANERGLSDVAGSVWEWTDTCFTRYAVDGQDLRPTTTNCGVRVVEGAHRTYMTNFIRDARAGGCAVGKPPANLGARLVREPRPVRRFVTGLVAWTFAL